MHAFYDTNHKNKKQNEMKGFYHLLFLIVVIVVVWKEQS